MIVKIIGGEPTLRLDRVYTKDMNEVIIGVDRGAYNALTFGIEVDYAIGDFDSVSQEQFTEIQKYAKNIKRYPPKKDKVDTELAIELALTMKPNIIILYGMTGSRLDHFIVNLNLLATYSNASVDIRIVDELNKLYVLEVGKHKLEKSKRKYFSLFAIMDSIVSVKGAVYDVEKRLIKQYDTFAVSNEALKQFVDIEVFQGRIILVESKDKD